MKKDEQHIRVVVVTLCHDGKGNYLLGKRSVKCRDEHGRWDLLGSGGLEYGETTKEAIVREVKEETGADVMEVIKLGTREVFRENSHCIAFDFKVEINKEQVINAEPEKCLEIDWFRIDNFPEPMHSQWPIFYEQYRDKL